MKKLPSFKSFPILSDCCKESLNLVQVRLWYLEKCNKTSEWSLFPMSPPFALSNEAPLFQIPNPYPHFIYIHAPQAQTYSSTPSIILGSKTVSNTILDLTTLTVWNISLFTFSVSTSWHKDSNKEAFMWYTQSGDSYWHLLSYVVCQDRS